MSKDNDTDLVEKKSSVNSISPYENIRLQYASKDEGTISDSQLRLACLEASVAFHDDKVVEDSSTIVDTAEQFWKFVNGSGR